MARILSYGGALLAAGHGPCVASRRSAPGAIQSDFDLFSLVPWVFSIDVAAMAARIFRSEIRDQTLSALAALPWTMRQLGRRKVRAGLLAAAPGALCVVASALLFVFSLPGSFSLSGSNGMNDMKVLMAAKTVSGCVNVVLLGYVVAWLSLVMKRGALPVGFVVTLAFQALNWVLCMIVAAVVIGLGAFSGYGWAAGSMTLIYVGPLVGCVASLVVVFILHWRIPPRLESLAGEN